MTKKKIFLISIVAFCLILAVFLFLSRSNKKPDKSKKMPVPVIVDVVTKKTVPIQIRAIGNVEPYSTVSIKSRVNGELTGVHFNEGKDVNKGDLLFTVDPRPFKAAFDSAHANLVKNTALYKKAEEDEKRYAELYKEQLVSRSMYEQIFANAEALKATIESDKAALENASLQLSYCSIYAPISGRTGSLLVDKGNQIKANDDKAMVVINQIQPIQASFSAPESSLAEIKKYMSKGKIAIEAMISTNDEKPAQGFLSFIDNTVDTTTGTIRLKGTFTNKDRKLWPGQFVTVVLTLAMQHDALIIPSQAVQTGQIGQYVFVVKEDLTVEMRPIEVIKTINSESVIKNGLQPGEKVVTDGQMLLVPGSKVEIKNPSKSTDK
jgi:multidrug efflux system membrane fusion protein